MANVARLLHALLLSVWFGALCQLCVLAPPIDRVVDSRHQASTVFLSVLASSEQYLLWVLPLLFATLWAGWSGLRSRGRGRTWLLLGLSAVLLLQRYVLRPRFETIRDGLGRPVEDLIPTDPAMLDYAWYEWLVYGALWLQGLSVFALLVWAMTQLRPRQSFGIEL